MFSIAIPKPRSYQNVKKEQGVGQRPANSKSLGTGIGRRPDECDAGFCRRQNKIPPRQSPFSLFNAAQFLRRVTVFPLTNNVLTTLCPKTPQCLATARLSSSACTYASKNRSFGASLQKAKKTRIAGLCGREVGACVHLPLSCTKIERAHFRVK